MTQKIYFLLFLFCSLSTQNEVLFVLSPQNTTVIDGAKVFFHCQPSATLVTTTSLPTLKLEFSIQWFWNDKKVDARKINFEVIDKDGYSILLINEAKKRFSAPIKCKVVTSDSQVIATSNTAYLNVITKNSASPGFPQISKPEPAKSYQISTNIFLSCQVFGDPEPRVSWFKNRLPLNQTEKRLYIEKASEEDAGSYECVASNIHGMCFSDSFIVYVKARRYGPYFSVKPQNASVEKGDSVNLRCVAVGLPFPTIEWFQDDEKPVQNAVFDENRNVLNMSDITRSVHLTCRGSSEIGQVSEKIKITVIDENEGGGKTMSHNGNKKVGETNREDSRTNPVSKETLEDIFTQLHTPHIPTPKVNILTYNHTRDIVLSVSAPPADSPFVEDFHSDWFYHLIVVPKNEYLIKTPQNFDLDEVKKSPPSSNKAWYFKGFSPFQLPVQFILKNSKNNAVLENRKIALDLSETSFKFFLRLLTDEGKEYSSDYSKPVEITKRAEADMGVWWLAVFPIILALTFVLIIIIIIASIRHKTPFAKKKVASYSNVDGNELLMNELGKNAESVYNGSGIFRDKSNATNLNAPKPMPISTNDLALKIKQLKQSEGHLLHKEYEEIDPGKQFTWEASLKEENSVKNRYANVVAYDHSRVVLKPLYGFYNDYINANLIPGLNGKKYIATQGPLPETIEDFWRLIWQSGSNLIVMLTKLQERNKIKCEPYWPLDGAMVYGNIFKVVLKKQLDLSFYTIRTFDVVLMNSQEHREIFHLQFMDWPEQGVPTHPTTTLHFINRIRSAYRLFPSVPIILHCSAGVGRTGCIIALDMCLDQLQNNIKNDSKNIKHTNKHNSIKRNNNSANNSSINLNYSSFMNIDKNSNNSALPSPSYSNSTTKYHNNHHSSIPKETLFFTSDSRTSPIDLHFYDLELTFGCVSNYSPNNNKNFTSSLNGNNFPTIDVFSTVNHLRSFRNYMVQSEDQYLFIHEALHHSITLPYSTEVPCHKLQIHFQWLQQEVVENPYGTKMSRLEFEFQSLSVIKHPTSCFTTATLPCSQHKNLHPSVLPLDENRVALQAVRGVEGSDYINASFIHSYCRRNTFIATHTPCGNQHIDFWRMAWEKDVLLIVMLDYQSIMPSYWPSDRSCRFNCFVIDPLQNQNYGFYALRTFRITDARDGQSRIITQLQVLQWSLERPAMSVVKAGEFSSLISQVQMLQQDSHPIIIHCSKGTSKTGVFIGAYNCIERAKIEGLVDVNESVKILKTQRPALVPYLNDYTSLYQTIVDYLHQS